MGWMSGWNGIDLWEVSSKLNPICLKDLVSYFDPDQKVNNIFKLRFNFPKGPLSQSMTSVCGGRAYFYVSW